MTVPQSEIKKVQDLLKVSTEENYLRIILYSYQHYNHRARLDIAEILYEKFRSLPDIPENDNLKRSLTAEMYSKLMQIIEDSALLLLMFTTEGKTPVDIFININNTMLYQFFGKAKRGILGDRTILKGLGLKPAKDLLVDGLIDQSELKDFERVISQLLEGTDQEAGEKKRWRGLGRIYTKEYRSPKGQGYKINRTKSNVISAYFNLKHNFKVLLHSPIFYKIWPLADNSVSLDIVEDYKKFGDTIKNLPNQLKPYEHQKVMILGVLDVSLEAITELYQRIFPQAQEIKMMAECQLRLLDDPTFTVRDIRYIIYLQSGKPTPIPQKRCVCGGSRKFRNCHGNPNRYNDDLVFNKLKYEPFQAPKSSVVDKR